MGNIKETFLNPIFKGNPISVLVLGICSSLAVTVQLKGAFVMGLSVIIVTGISSLICSLLRNTIPNLESEERSASEKLTEEGYDHEDHSISETVSETVHQGCERLVAESISLDTSHDDTVGDDEADVHRESLAYTVCICLEHLVNEDYHEGNHYELNDDTDTVRNCVSEE